MVGMFSSCKAVQNPMVQGQKYGYNHEEFCCIWIATSPLQWELVQTKETVVHFVYYLFYTLQSLTNRWLPNYHVNMISSNILFLGSFFSQTDLLTHFGFNYIILKHPRVSFWSKIRQFRKKKLYVADTSL